MRRYLWRLYKYFQGEIIAIPGRSIAFFSILLLPLIPLITQDPYVLRILIFTNLYAVFAASWDLLAGFTGQLNLGHAFSFGIGSFTAAFLNLYLGLPPWATIPLGAIGAIVGGLIICMPALKLRGIYLALVTLAFPVILTGVILAFHNYTGGELGLSGLTRLSESRIFSYYLSLIFMILSAMIMWKLTDINSKIVRTGVIFRAIREDEITARASGINTTKYKILAFIVSGFFAGLSGGFYAHFIRLCGPSTLEILFTFQAIIWTIFGGMGTIYGPIVGVYILFPLTEVLRVLPEIRMLTFAIVIILILRFMPEGLCVWLRDKMEEECPRCKLINIAIRQHCRACNAALHLERRQLKNSV